jgi:hypothetical protein
MKVHLVMARNDHEPSYVAAVFESEVDAKRAVARANKQSAAIQEAARRLDFGMPDAEFEEAYARVERLRVAFEFGEQLSFSDIFEVQTYEVQPARRAGNRAAAEQAKKAKHDSGASNG